MSPARRRRQDHLGCGTDGRTRIASLAKLDRRPVRNARALGEGEQRCTARIGRRTLRAAVGLTDRPRRRTGTSQLSWGGRKPGGGSPRFLSPNVQALAALAPFLVMAAVAAVDLGAGPSLGLLPLFSLGPALAAVWLTPRGTALVGVIAVLACLPLASFDGVLDTRRTGIAVAAVAGVTGAGVVASFGRLRRERDLADVQAVADAMQRVLLRPVPSRVGDLAIAVRCTSASTSAQVGGDLYEVIRATGKVRLIIADVQGQGLAAVGTAAVVLGAFREAAYDAPSLTAIASRIELSLQRRETDEEFVTAILAEVADGSPTMELLYCGHPPPLVLSAGAASFAEPAEPGLPLGLAALCDSPRETTSVSFRPGDRALFYTDGVSEARNQAGGFYPLSRRAGLLADEHLPAALDRLDADIVRHRRHAARDDTTTVLIARVPALAPRAAPAVTPGLPSRDSATGGG
jgi:Stage II sporulation protein E (SpoIIE)